MNEVASGLFVSDIQAAGSDDRHEANGVDVVVRLTRAAPERGYPDAVTVRAHPMADGPQNDPDAVVEAVETVVNALERGQTVLVHCSVGASRSPAVAAAALAVHRDLEFETALDQVRDARDLHVHAAVRENARQATATLRGD